MKHTRMDAISRYQMHVALLRKQAEAAKSAIFKAVVIVRENVEEVRENGAVIGYWLNLGVDQTRELWKALTDSPLP